MVVYGKGIGGNEILAKFNNCKNHGLPKPNAQKMILVGS